MKNVLIEKEDAYVQKRLKAQPLHHLIGATFGHYKNEGKYYNITGFTKDKETKRLVVCYRRTDASMTLIPWSQKAARFFGTVFKNGLAVERFSLVEEGNLIDPT